MDFIPPPNRDDFKDQKEYEDALKKWEKEFKKFSSIFCAYVGKERFNRK